MITSIQQASKPRLSEIVALEGELRTKSNQTKKLLVKTGEKKKRVLQLRDVLFLLKRRKDTSHWAENYLTENDVLIKNLEDLERQITKNFREISDLLLSWEVDARLKFLRKTTGIKLSLLGTAFWDFVKSHQNKVKSIKIAYLDVFRKVDKIQKTIGKYDKKVQKLGQGKVPTSIKQILEGYKTVVVGPLKWIALIVGGVAAIYLLPKILPSK